MNDDLMPHRAPLLPLPVPTLAIGSALTVCIDRRKIMRAHAVAVAGRVELLLAGVQEVGDAQAERAALVPAAVGEGRIVGARGREVPLLVGGVEAGAVSVRWS